MNRSMRVLGLALSSLTIATVAIAQQNNGQGKNQHAALQLLHEEASGKPRLTRAIQTRPSGMNCLTQTCAEPPVVPQRPVRIVRYNAGCQGGDTFMYRDYDGQLIQGSCMAR